MDNRKYLFIPLLFMLILSFTIPPILYHNGYYSGKPVDIKGGSRVVLSNINLPLTPKPVLYNVTLDNSSIRFLEELSKIPDKLTGHNGSLKTAQVILGKLDSLGIPTGSEKYPVVVPVNDGSYLLVNGVKLDVYPLWPSGGVPVNVKVNGRAVVARSLSDLDGVDLHDTIVFLPMTVDYQWQWLFDPHLGVRAVFFYDTPDTVNSNMYNKYLDIPVNLPIGYLSTRILRSRGLSLSDLNGKIVEVNLRSKWRVSVGVNVYAYIPGQRHDHLVVLLTHYDSWSPAIGLAPGATDSIGTAYLYRLVRVFRNKTPSYDTLIAFLSGHYMGLAGSRFFVEKHVFNKTPINLGNYTVTLDPAKTIYVGIDLNPNTIYVAPVSIGYFYTATAGSISRGPMDYFNRFITVIYTRIGIEETIGKLLGKSMGSAEKALYSYALDPQRWWSLFPGPFWLDTETMWHAGLPAFTLKSALANRGKQATPIDYYDDLNTTNIAVQFRVLDGLLSILYNLTPEEMDKAIRQGTTTGAPTRTTTTDRLEMFADLVGQVMVWNPRLGQQIPLDKAGLPPALVIISAGSRLTATNPWNLRIYLLTNKQGYFKAYGLPTSRSMSLALNVVVLSSDGKVLALNDMGHASHGSSVSLYQPVTGSREHPWEVWIVKFNGSIRINMVIDPLTYQTPAEGGKIGYKLVRQDTLAQPDYFYLGLDENGFFVAYVTRSNMNYSIVFGPEPVYYVYEKVKPGHTYSPYDALVSTTNIVSRRIEKLIYYKVRDPATEEFLSRSKYYLDEARSALSEYNYTRYRVYVRTGITLSYNAYQLMKSAYLDIENTATLFSILLVLFAFITALYFRKPGASPFSVLGKTIIATLIPGALFFYIHPAFHLTANAIMTIIGFIMIILVTPALLVLLGDFNAALKEVRKKKVGAHVVERSRVATSYISFSYGVEYMKKRKLRTWLTLITLIMVVISIVIFTSVSTYVAPKPLLLHGYTPTRPEGLLLQRETIDRNLPIGSQLVENVRVLFNGTAVARYWAITAYPIYPYNSPEQFLPMQSIVGTEPSEDRITNISRIIVSGRWFNDNDTYSVILPAYVVNITNGKIKVGSIVSLAGVELKVVGLYDSKKLINIVEGDGATITPVIGFPRARDLSGCAFIPARLARINPWLGNQVQFFVGQVSVRTPFNPLKISKDIIYMIPSVDTYLITPMQTVAKYSRLIALGGSGFNYVVAPIVIASVSILGVLLGSIYERRREIFIYAALGLSPTQIGLMFIAEALAYALIATVIGYVIGVVTTAVTATLMPEVFRPNFSSKYVVFALSATIIAVLSATIYPVFKASKMALPSLRRKWEYPTKPKGDEWIIPLPFKITTLKELYGALYYLYEYIKEFTSPDLGSFVVEKIGFEKGTTSDGKSYVMLRGEARLKPWHAGIKQYFEVKAVETGPGEWEVSIYLKRLSGHVKTWVKSNKPFIDAVRKQLLLWRTLHPEDKKRYIESAKSIFQ